MAMYSVDEFDDSAFRRTLALFPSGVVIVTGMDQNVPLGFTVSAFASVSLSPPLVGLFVGPSSISWPRIRQSGRFAVNILADAQEELCRRFATRDDGKFNSVEWMAGRNGMPLLCGAAGHIECDIHDVVPTGDHSLVLGKITALGRQSGTAALVAFRGGLHAIEAG
jgi:3-hydroxy-9,10-secoandrosta-1,3,5(10)-triene-9,17-dione monooxygenase reductase component